MRAFFTLCLLLVSCTLFGEKVAMQLSPMQGESPEQVWVVVNCHVEDGWHLYWKNPGEARFPVRLNWSLPKGVTLGKEIWEVPEKFTLNGQRGYGKKGHMTIAQELKIPEGTEPFKASVKMEWLACRETCVPGISSTQVMIGGDFLTPSFAKWKKTHPRMPDTLSLAGFAGASFAQEVDKMEFFPLEFGKVNKLGRQTWKQGDYFPAEEGVLAFYSSEGKILGTWYVEPTLFAAIGQGLFKWILLAFLGGVILNFMPCVLPIISLKLFSLIRVTKESRYWITMHGVATTLGVLTCFWGLGVGLILSKLAGEAQGWGFQFQSPVFVAALMGVFFFCALSFLGAFEMGSKFSGYFAGFQTSKASLWGSFFNGMLFTLVSTPCTGPFLGSVFGLASTLSPAAIFILFTAVGLGLAAPFLILCLSPSALKLLPKPGEWMVTMKEIMGLCMLGAAFWMLWVLSVFADVGDVKWAIFASFSVICAAVVLFKWKIKSVATVFVLLALFSGLQIPKHQDVGWENYSEERVSQAHLEGQSVFVEFTAAWCLICQTNKWALHDESVAQAFKERQITPLKADWTKQDEIIRQSLASFGRNGVPLYVLYAPDQSPILLPQILTPGIILESLEKLNETS